MGATPTGYVSIHGKRLGLLGNGMLSVDGKAFKGAIPTLGKDIFVDSVTGNDNSDGLTPDRAVATLDASFALCTANKGYQVFCLPLHAETITGAAGIAHDVAGVSVYGLGHGGQRPTFLMDGGTAVTYKITANDALVSNLILNAGHNDIVTCIDVQVATDAWIDQIEFTDNTTNENYLSCVKSGTTTDNECDGLKITGCQWYSLDAGSLSFLVTLGDLDRLHVEGNRVITEGTASPLITTTAGDDHNGGAFIFNNHHQSQMTANDLFIDNDQANNRGFVSHNYMMNLDTAIEVHIDMSGVGEFENYQAGAVDKQGYLLDPDT